MRPYVSCLAIVRPQLSNENQADITGTVQQPHHEAERAKDAIAEASFMVEELDLSFLFNNDDDIFATTSSMDLEPLSISSYDIHLSAPSHGHDPFRSALSTMHLPAKSYETLAGGFQSGYVMESSPNQAGRAKVIDKWALNDPLDNTAGLLRALKQIPDNKEGSRMPWYLSTGQGPLCRYVGSSFWALSGTKVGLHLYLTTTAYEICYMGRACEHGIDNMPIQKGQVADIESHV